MHLHWLAPIAAAATLLGGWLVVRFLRGKASLMRHNSGLAGTPHLQRVMP
ncbi:hypothetical protein [Holophaga foetida]|nr:hypothetical protein [Holophaga foetida]